MKVALLPELFDPPVQNLQLLAILGHAIEGRHRIELETTHPSIAAWLAVQSPGLQAEIELALERSTLAESREPSHTAVTVTRAGPSNFESSPIRLHLEDARRVLGGAFVVVLEDDHSDRAFLERMMTEEELRLWRQRVDAGFVRVDHGGGLGPMTRRVREATAEPLNRHLMWVIFDSDAMQPGQPSADSQALRAACGRIAHHQLGRRYTESYLTRNALQAWAANVANRADREERLQRYRSFVGMRDDQRHHFNMKHGFDRDARRTDATAGSLYGDVPDHDRRTLARGFGEDIGDLFTRDSVTEADLRRDTGWAELRPVIRDLLARIS